MNSDERKERDATAPSNKAKGATRAESDQQGISNRPGDEDPDSGVDPAPGPRQAKDSTERNK